MIKKVRVDYRLLHGQVAFSWTSKLSADCILLVTDTLQDDPVRVTSVKLAKPPGVKVVVKTIEESIKAIKSGITDKYHLFVVCENIEGAYRLVKELGIKELNLGGTTPGDDKRSLAPVVYVNQKEEEMLKGLIEDGVHVYQQGVPEKAEQTIRL